MTGTDVVAYFADDPSRVYQLVQWLPVLERLDARHPVRVVTRDPATAEVVRDRTGLPVLLAPSFAELSVLYADLGARVVVYVNNSMRNFESLVDARMLHVHVNHGESDKQSMSSNNAKAYDRVLVAGPAAVERHAAALLDFDLRHLVPVGRPQLDLVQDPTLTPSLRRTVLYAPTWEGDAEWNDYTSIDLLGPRIAAALLAVPEVRVVYKPHPKVTTSAVPAVQDGHHAVLETIARAVDHDPDAGHLSVTEGDILAVMPGCDLMVADVSSVGLDWLYLRTDRPLVLTDRHADGERLRTEVPVSRCADVIDRDTVAGLTDLVAARLEVDAHREARAAMRRHYFGDLQPGESTDRFLATMADLVALRDRLVDALPSRDGEGAA